MKSQRTLCLFTIFLIVISLGLSACVRPVPEGEGDGETQPAPETGDPNVGGGTNGGDPSGEEAQPAPEGDDQSGDEAQPAPEGGDQSGDEAQPAPEGGDQSGDEAQPAPEGGDQSGDEAQPAPEGGDQSGGETQPETVPPAAGGQPTGGTIGTPPTTEVIHYVQPGENLFRIGLHYGYSWVVLARYNGIPNPNYIYVGQPIRIPAAGGGGGGGMPPTEGGYTNYVVQPGDNLFRIGLKYGMSWIYIAEANGLTNPNYLVPGQVLKIPVVAVPYGS